MHAKRLQLLTFLVLAPALFAVARADDRTPKGDKEQSEPTSPIKTPPAALAALHFKVRTGIDVAEDPRGLVVKHVREESDAADAGIKDGDVLLRVNDHTVHTGEELQQYLGNHATDPAYMVTVRRGTRQFEVPLGRKTSLMGMLLFADRTDRPTVRQVDAGSAAEEAGLKPGDLIGGVAGRRIETFKQFLELTIPLVQRTAPGHHIPFDVVRGGREIQLAVNRPNDPGLPLLPPPSTPHPRPPVSLSRVPAPPRPMRERRNMARRNRPAPGQRISNEDFLRGLSGLPPINANIQQNNAPQSGAPQNAAPQNPAPQSNVPPTTNGSQIERHSNTLLAAAPVGVGLTFPMGQLAALLAAADPAGKSASGPGGLSGILLAQAAVNPAGAAQGTSATGTGTGTPTIPNPLTGNTGTPQGINPITGNAGTATGTNAGFVNNLAAQNAANQNNAAANAGLNGGLNGGIGTGLNVGLGNLTGYQGVTRVVATLHASQVAGNTGVTSNATSTGTNGTGTNGTGTNGTRSNVVNRDNQNLLTPGSATNQAGTNQAGTNQTGTNAGTNGTSGTANAIQPGQIVGFVIVMSNPYTNATNGLTNGITGTTSGVNGTTTGINGTTAGVNGTATGINGTAGVNGTGVGVNGSTGINGTAGINGTNGTVGNNGTTGQTIISARVAGLAPGTYVLAVNQFGDCGDVMSGSAGGVSAVLGTITITSIGQGSFTSVANVNPQSLLGRVVTLSPGTGSSGQVAPFPSRAAQGNSNQTNANPANANQTNANQANANQGTTASMNSTVVQACGVFGLGNPRRSFPGMGNGFGGNGFGGNGFAPGMNNGAGGVGLAPSVGTGGPGITTTVPTTNGE